MMVSLTSLRPRLLDRTQPICSNRKGGNADWWLQASEQLLGSLWEATHSLLQRQSPWGVSASLVDLL